MIRIESEGLKDLLKDLRRVDTDRALRNELKDGNQRVADIAGDAIRSRLTATGRRSAARAAATAITPLRRQDAPTLLFDGRRFPGVHGELWGARRDRPRTGPSGRKFRGLNQFPAPIRPGIPHRAVDDEARRIVDTYADIIEAILRGHE